MPYPIKQHELQRSVLIAFIVIGKTLIKDHSKLNRNLKEAFAPVNNILRASNSEEMCIAAFEGVLNMKSEEFRKELLAAAKADADLFAGDAPQFDDIIMRCLRYRGAGESRWEYPVWSRFAECPHRVGKHRGTDDLPFADGALAL